MSKQSTGLYKTSDNLYLYINATNGDGINSFGPMPLGVDDWEGNAGFSGEWSACPETVVVVFPAFNGVMEEGFPGYTYQSYTNPVMADVYTTYGGDVYQYPVYTLSGDVSGYPQNIYCASYSDSNMELYQCLYHSVHTYKKMCTSLFDLSFLANEEGSNRVDYNKATSSMPYIIIDANDYYGGGNPDRGAAKSSYPANVPYNIVDTNLTFDYFDIYEESNVEKSSSGGGELKKGDTSTTKATASNVVPKPFKIIIRNYYQSVKGDETTYEQIAYGFLDPFYTDNGFNLYYNDEPTLENNPIPLDGDEYRWYVFAYTSPTTIMWGVEGGLS